jgi:cytochrome c oxidase cbb3-type subunit III
MLACLLGAGAQTLVGCSRESHDFRPVPPYADPAIYRSKLESNAYALSEGKRLYAAFNCNGCHVEGGGAIGPALMDEKWIYGSEPEKVFETISHGRPNGMPAFGGKAGEPGIKVVGNLPEHERWLLVSYVRSLSGLVSKTAAPGRDDHMQSKEPENSVDTQTPVLTPPPDAGNKPK